MINVPGKLLLILFPMWLHTYDKIQAFEGKGDKIHKYRKE